MRALLDFVRRLFRRTPAPGSCVLILYLPEYSYDSLGYLAMTLADFPTQDELRALQDFIRLTPLHMSAWDRDFNLPSSRRLITTNDWSQEQELNILRERKRHE